MEEDNRLSKFKAITEKLKCGENMQNHQLKILLSEDGYAQVDIEWQEKLELS